MDGIVEFLRAKSIWETVAGGPILAMLIAICAWLWRRLRGTRAPDQAEGDTGLSAGDNAIQVGGSLGDGNVLGTGASQTVIQNFTVNHYYFVDGLPESALQTTREQTRSAQQLMEKRHWRGALGLWQKLRDAAESASGRSAAFLQAGNCHLSLRHFGEAARAFADARQLAI